MISSRPLALWPKQTIKDKSPRLNYCLSWHSMSWQISNSEGCCTQGSRPKSPSSPSLSYSSRHNMPWPSQSSKGYYSCLSRHKILWPSSLQKDAMPSSWLVTTPHVMTKPVSIKKQCFQLFLSRHNMSWPNVSPTRSYAFILTHHDFKCCHYLKAQGYIWLLTTLHVVSSFKWKPLVIISPCKGPGVVSCSIPPNCHLSCQLNHS